LNEGFTRLAAFISGANVTGQRVPMTRPVLVTSATSTTRRNRAGSWQPPSVAPLAELNGLVTRKVAFVMPENWKLDELPLPTDPRVQLRGVPARRMAVLSFRGSYSGDLPAQKRNELLFLLKCAGFKPAAEVWFAAHDGPSTLPLLRRNEVLVELDD
jgi:hypothetical protein